MNGIASVHSNESKRIEHSSAETVYLCNKCRQLIAISNEAFRWSISVAGVHGFSTVQSLFSLVLLFWHFITENNKSKCLGWRFVLWIWMKWNERIAIICNQNYIALLLRCDTHGIPDVNHSQWIGNLEKMRATHTVDFI